MPQMTSVSKYKEPRTYQVKVEYFKGVDLTNQPANVDIQRACNGINMIRDNPGKVRKRMGYFEWANYTARINGVYEFENDVIVHAGNNLYRHANTPVELYSGINNDFSSAVRLNGKLWIFDGLEPLVYGEFDGINEVKKIADIAYVPTVNIGRRPNGGGTRLEPVNMLTNMRKDSFLGTATDNVYQLFFDDLSSDAVKVEKMNASGDFVVVDSSGYTVNRTEGTITFTTAPGVSPIEGEDNVIVTYGVENEDYKNRIKKCTIAICYGISASIDRIFITGNDDYRNYDFYCQLNDPTYWGDIWYGIIGQEHSPIMGYSIINGHLATHKLNDDNGRNIILRYGSLDTDGDPQFLQTGIIQGPGAIAKHAFGYAEEPIFLTAQGICSTTPYSYNSERYVQNRSFYINNPLTKELNLENAYCCVFKDFYVLAVNNQFYILDTYSKTAQNSERSDFQYEAYLFDNMPARIVFTINDEIYFGTDFGKIMKFYTDPTDSRSYSDNGAAISCRWDFDFSGNDFYNKKWTVFFSIQLAPAAQSRYELWVCQKNDWKLYMRTTDTQSGFLDFNNISFDSFTFDTDRFPITAGKKIKVKKYDTIRFSLRNENLYDSFGFYQLAIEYKEAGYYRRST